MLKFIKKLKYNRVYLYSKPDPPPEPEDPLYKKDDKKSLYIAPGNRISTDETYPNIDRHATPDDMVWPVRDMKNDSFCELDKIEISIADQAFQKIAYDYNEEHAKKFETELNQHVQNYKNVIDPRHHPHIDEYHMNMKNALSQLISSFNGGIDIKNK